MESPKLKMSFDPHTIEHLGIKMYSVLPNAIAELKRIQSMLNCIMITETKGLLLLTMGLECPSMKLTIIF